MLNDAIGQPRGYVKPTSCSAAIEVAAVFLCMTTDSM
jgi:hypothetical protein